MAIAIQASQVWRSRGRLEQLDTVEARVAAGELTEGHEYRADMYRLAATQRDYVNALAH